MVTKTQVCPISLFIHELSDDLNPDVGHFTSRILLTWALSISSLMHQGFLRNSFLMPDAGLRSLRSVASSSCTKSIAHG